MMEHPDRERGPPHKRRKSAEEKRSVEEREGHRAAAAAGATGGKEKYGRRDHQHQDPSAGRHSRPNQHFIDGSQDRKKNGAGKDVNRENIRDKDVERTKNWNKNRMRKDSTSRDETLNRGRSEHQQGGYKDSQTGGSRTQTPKSKPEQDPGYVQKPKPNSWFKERCTEKQREHHRNTKGPEEMLSGISSDGGKWTEILSQTCNTTHPSNPWHVGEANRQPSPPGTSSPDRLQDKATPVKRKFTLSSFVSFNFCAILNIVMYAAKHFPKQSTCF